VAHNVNSHTIAFVCHAYHRGGVTRWMVDAALHWARTQKVFFVTVEPATPFLTAGKNEPVLDLLRQGDAANVEIITEKVNWKFEFGSAEYKLAVYTRLMSRVPVGATVILSDDPTVWSLSSLLHGSYKMLGVLHGNHEPYFQLSGQYRTSIHKLICVSARVRNSLFEKQPAINTSHTAIIPCGILLPEMPEQVPDNEVLQLAFIGRVEDQYKRVSDLYPIALALQQRGISFNLNVIGDGSRKAYLETSFKESGMEHSVTFHGWCGKEEIYKILQGIDIVVLTSDIEGMPIAMMEGLASGCAVVSTRVSGVEDYEGTTVAKDCLWVNPIGDAGAAAANIELAMKVPLLHRRRQARTMGVQEFSMDTCISRYEEVIAGIPDISEGAQFQYKPQPLTQQLASHARAFLRFCRVRLAQR
jgi:glycosyltransferase involved in cell wall biosynthesis